jgi:hypothetical protein
MRNLRLVAVVAVLAAGIGCSSSPRAAPPLSRAQVTSKLTDAYLQYARCAREHGLPNLPDPQVDDQGNDIYPPGSTPAAGFPQSVLDGCATAWNTVRHWRDQFDATQPQRGGQQRTSAQIQSGVRFAQCVRTHGYPTFPDPNPDGQPNGPLPPGFEKPNLSEGARAVIITCQSTSR